MRRLGADERFEEAPESLDAMSLVLNAANAEAGGSTPRVSVRWMPRFSPFRAPLTFVILQSFLVFTLGCEEVPAECLRSIADDEYAPCVRSCEDGNSSSCEFMSEYLGDRCRFDDNLGACQFLCARGESLSCDRIPRILSMTSSTGTPADGPATAPTASTGTATPSDSTDVRRLEEQLNVSTQELLGRFRLALPGQVTLVSEDADGYRKHTFDQLIEGRSFYLLIHEYPEGTSPSVTEAPLSEASRLFTVSQHGEIVLETDRIFGEGVQGRQLKFTTTSRSRGRTLHHDLLVFDVDNVRFYIHLTTANQFMLDESTSYIAGSFASL